jgi:hypothetical protein
MNHIGKRVLQACEIIEQHGPCGYLIVAQTAGVLKPNACKSVSKAVKLGLMTVEKPAGRGNSGDCNIYTAVPGWREIAVDRTAKKIKQLAPRKLEPAYLPTPRNVSFVFNLGTVEITNESGRKRA